VNHCTSLDAPIGGGDSDDAAKTLADTMESEADLEDCYANDDAILLVQSYINRNKVIEAILLDNIAFNDVQRHYTKTVKAESHDGNTYRYTEHSSEFWPYRLIQIVSKLPEEYKHSFMKRYNISEEKLTSILDVIGRANNQKLYRYLEKTLSELRATYAV
jgi:hypothetical protein